MIHDRFCRCRSCKPGLDKVGGKSSALDRMVVGLVALVSTAAFLMALRFY